MANFPIQVTSKGIEEVRVCIADNVEFVLCNHGAHVLAQMLLDVAKGQYCDGYRHGDESTMFVTVKTKRLVEVRPSDIPHGMSAEDVAIDG